MKVYTPQEAAVVLKLSTRTVYNLLRSGQIKARKVGNLWRISEKSLEGFLEGTNGDK